MTEEMQTPAKEGADVQDPKTAAPAGSFFAKALSFGGEMLHVVLISLAIIVPVRYFLIQPFYVKGASMEPNFLDHEYLIIDEISYRFHPPERGDVVVFRYPNDPKQFFIKRVIGLPGERVVVSGGEVTVYDSSHPSGTKLDETPFLKDVKTGGDKDVTLGADELYLLGDNRPNSLDSRIFGPVQMTHVIGRVWLRGWPPERATLYGSQSGLIGELK
ncbi:MAG: hypothetical protein RLZZ324_21 [Candidatus Parcubacteria bacterium]|jgi:signal peptidase I